VIAAVDPEHYIIENVARCDDLRDPCRLNGLAFGLPFDLERHFETSFSVPDAVEHGEPTVGVYTRKENDQSVRELAEAKGVPSSWGKQGVRSAIPAEFVRWLLSYCPTVDVDRPAREQTTLDKIAT